MKTWCRLCHFLTLGMFCFFFSNEQQEQQVVDRYILFCTIKSDHKALGSAVPYPQSKIYITQSPSLSFPISNVLALITLVFYMILLISCFRLKTLLIPFVKRRDTSALSRANTVY